MKPTLLKTKPKQSSIKIPDGFKLVIDTREQLPLFQNKNIPTINKALKHGDYSIDDMENLISIERKMTSDFFSYIGKERKKTERKLRNLSEMEYACLVIEGINWEDLQVQQVYTTLQPNHVRGFRKALEIKYGVHWFCNRSRKEVERFVLERLVYYYKKKKGIK